MTPSKRLVKQVNKLVEKIFIEDDRESTGGDILKRKNGSKSSVGFKELI